MSEHSDVLAERPSSQSSSSLAESTLIDQARIKVLYIAIYLGLEILDANQLPSLNRYYARVTRPRVADLVENQTMFTKLFPTSLNEVFTGFVSGLGSVDRNKAREKWRWVTRNHSDAFLYRYLGAYTDLTKAARCVGEGILMQMTRFNAEVELGRGEQYYLAQEPHYIEHFKRRYIHLVGFDNAGSPFVILEPYHFKKKDMPRDLIDRTTLNILEHVFLLMPRYSEGATILMDLHGLKAHQWDGELIKSFLRLTFCCYPMTSSRLLLHRSSKTFSLFWKLFKSFFDSSRTKVIVFTHTTEDLLEYIPSDQLPQYLGGTSTYDMRNWTGPREADEIHDESAKSMLLGERQRLLLDLERDTIEWVASDKLPPGRAQTLAALDSNYWKLDPYVRKRNIWDRHGTMGLLRPQFLPGHTSQPACEIKRPQLEPASS